MTQEELDAAVKKLIAEANDLSAEQNRKYAAAYAKAEGAALKNRTARSTIFGFVKTDLKEACDRALKKIQDDLDESLAALYPKTSRAAGAAAVPTRPTKWIIPCPCGSATSPSKITISPTTTRRRRWKTV
ncbi:MAG: hypothetical protein ACLRTQ_09555 [Candidatus Borkfalkia sp.]